MITMLYFVCQRTVNVARADQVRDCLWAVANETVGAGF
jgi:hypothetical protein